MNKTDGVYSDSLQCEWSSWHIKIEKNESRITLYMPPGHCCDMNGAVNIAKELCGQVSRIETFSGDVPDTTYIKDAVTGEWSAHDVQG